MTHLQKSSLVDQLYEQIKINIINLTYPMGSKININEMQNHFGVSSTPLREAITRLQAEGLVTYENNVGAKVINLKAKDVEDIHDLVLTLHKMAIRLAMKIGDHKRMADEMLPFVKGYTSARAADEEINNTADLIGTFYRHCGNTRLDKNMKIIQGQQLLLRYLYRKHMNPQKTKTNHLARIEKAVRAGKTELIMEILSDYYKRAEDILIKAMGALENQASAKSK